jgi:hypothetical protein
MPDQTVSLHLPMSVIDALIARAGIERMTIGKYVLPVEAQAAHRPRLHVGQGRSGDVGRDHRCHRRPFGPRVMARVLIIESGDDFRASELPDEWDTDDIDRYLNGRAYGRAAVVTVESMADDDPDDFLPTGGGEYGGGSL